MKGQFICYTGRCITTALNIDFLPSFILGWDIDAENCNNVGVSLSDLGYFPRLSAAINLAYYLTLVISTKHIKPYWWPVWGENGELSYWGMDFADFVIQMIVLCWCREIANLSFLSWCHLWCGPNERSTQLCGAAFPGLCEEEKGDMMLSVTSSPPFSEMRWGRCRCRVSWTPVLLWF